MTKFYHGIIGFLALSMIILGFGLTRPGTLFYQITQILYTFYQVGWYVAASQWYLTIYLRKLWLMGRRHFYEFKLHAWRDII